MAVTIKRVWHYGNDYRAEFFEGETLELAMMKAAPADMPEGIHSEAVTILTLGLPYRSWSWYTFSVVPGMPGEVFTSSIGQRVKLDEHGDLYVMGTTATEWTFICNSSAVQSIKEFFKNENLHKDDA